MTKWLSTRTHTNVHTHTHTHMHGGLCVFWFQKTNIYIHTMLALILAYQHQKSWKLALCTSVQSLSRVWLFVTPWTAAHQASLSITNLQSLLKLMSIEWVMPSNHLILCHPLLLLPSIFPSIRVFSKESVLHIRWPKFWSFSFNISPSNEYSGHFV